MVNSSPEYAITKAGIHHLKKRDKSLKTYGKRQSTPSESPVEQPRKRVRFADNLTSDEPDVTPPHPRQSPKRDETILPDSEKDTEGREAEVAEPPIAKQSILNYFKRVAPPKQRQISPDTADNEEDMDEPKPESPEQRHHKIRRKRILRIRSNQSPRTERESDDNDCDSPGTDGQHTPLSEGGEALHNQQRRTLRSEKRKRQKARLAPQVQTTLNLSSQAAFSECKICDTVWNPLYPDDVKYHTKRHAVHLRGRKRAIDEL